MQLKSLLHESKEVLLCEELLSGIKRFIWLLSWLIATRKVIKVALIDFHPRPKLHPSPFDKGLTTTTTSVANLFCQIKLNNSSLQNLL